MVIKKILLNIIKIFYESEPNRYLNCLNCKKVLIGSQRKFCSVVCNNKYYSQLYSGKKKKDIYYKQVSKEERELVQKKWNARKIAYKKYPSLKGIKCEFCKKKSENRHHEDYDKPKEVNLLCWECHGKIHSGFIKINSFNKLKGGKI